MLRIFKNSFFYRTPPIAAFLSTPKGRRGKRGTKERGKIFQMKEENENISFVLVKTEMQIQLCKYYRTSQSFFLNFLCDSCMLIFVLSFLTK